MLKGHPHTSHPRSTVVLLDTETPGTSREIYSEVAEGETRTRNPWRPVDPLCFSDEKSITVEK